jgi:hypothetical protein
LLSIIKNVPLDKLSTLNKIATENPGNTEKIDKFINTAFSQSKSSNSNSIAANNTETQESMSQSSNLYPKGSLQMENQNQMSETLSTTSYHSDYQRQNFYVDQANSRVAVNNRPNDDRYIWRTPKNGDVESKGFSNSSTSRNRASIEDNDSERISSNINAFFNSARSINNN